MKYEDFVLCHNRVLSGVEHMESCVQSQRKARHQFTSNPSPETFLDLKIATADVDEAKAYVEELKVQYLAIRNQMNDLFGIPNSELIAGLGMPSSDFAILHPHRLEYIYIPSDAQEGGA